MKTDEIKTFSKTETGCPECGTMQTTDGVFSWCENTACHAHGLHMKKDWKI